MPKTPESVPAIEKKDVEPLERVAQILIYKMEERISFLRYMLQSDYLAKTPGRGGFRDTFMRDLGSAEGGAQSISDLAHRLKEAIPGERLAKLLGEVQELEKTIKPLKDELIAQATEIERSYLSRRHER